MATFTARPSTTSGSGKGRTSSCVDCSIDGLVDWLVGSMGWLMCRLTALEVDWSLGVFYSLNDGLIDSFIYSPQFGAADAEVKSHLLRTQSLKVLPLKP